MRGSETKNEKIQMLFLGTLLVLAAATLACVAAAKAAVPANVGRPLAGAEKDEIVARNSPLTEYVHLSPRADIPRPNSIEKITIHFMAGDLSLEEVGEVYSRADRTASANYGIDSQGRVGLYVEEANASRTSGDKDNDSRAVNIEVANDEIRGRWHVSDEAFDSLVALVTDICSRNGIDELTFTGNSDGTLTLHRMFQNTDCPGNYLLRKIPRLVAEVNEELSKTRLGGAETDRTGERPAGPGNFDSDAVASS